MNWLKTTAFGIALAATAFGTVESVMAQQRSRTADYGVTRPVAPSQTRSSTSVSTPLPATTQNARVIPSVSAQTAKQAKPVFATPAFARSGAAQTTVAPAQTTAAPVKTTAAPAQTTAAPKLAAQFRPVPQTGAQSKLAARSKTAVAVASVPAVRIGAQNAVVKNVPVRQTRYQEEVVLPEADLPEADLLDADLPEADSTDSLILDPELDQPSEVAPMPTIDLPQAGQAETTIEIAAPDAAFEPAALPAAQPVDEPAANALIESAPAQDAAPAGPDPFAPSNIDENAVSPTELESAVPVDAIPATENVPEVEPLETDQAPAAVAPMPKKTIDKAKASDRIPTTIPNAGADGKRAPSPKTDAPKGDRSDYIIPPELTREEKRDGGMIAIPPEKGSPRARASRSRTVPINVPAVLPRSKEKRDGGMIAPPKKMGAIYPATFEMLFPNMARYAKNGSCLSCARNGAAPQTMLLPNDPRCGLVLEPAQTCGVPTIGTGCAECGAFSNVGGLCAPAAPSVFAADPFNANCAPACASCASDPFAASCFPTPASCVPDPFAASCAPAANYPPLFPSNCGPAPIAPQAPVNAAPTDAVPVPAPADAVPAPADAVPATEQGAQSEVAPAVVPVARYNPAAPVRPVVSVYANAPQAPLPQAPSASSEFGVLDPPAPALRQNSAAWGANVRNRPVQYQASPLDSHYTRVR